MFTPKSSKISEGVPCEKKSLKLELDGTEPCEEFDILEIEWVENNLESLELQVATYFANKTTGAVQVSHFRVEEARKLYERFQESGLKLKFDWFAALGKAIYRMPGRLHSLTLGTWTHSVYAGLSDSLKAQPGCKKQSLMFGGDAAITLEDGSIFHPDGYFAIREGQGEGAITRHRVVIESLASQKLAAGRKKAEHYLLKSDQVVHAVILLNFENRPQKGNIDLPCTATLEVWVRTPTGDNAKDYPWDACHLTRVVTNNVPSSFTGEGQQVDLVRLSDGPKESLNSPDGGNEESDKGSTWSEGVTKVNEADLPLDPRVHRRDELLVYNEVSGSAMVEDELELDVYDFLRPCQEHPDVMTTGEDRTITLPLASLREAIHAALLDDRRDLREAQASLETSKGVKRGREEEARPTEEVELGTNVQTPNIGGFVSKKKLRLQAS
ncbi:unnamed protein product [Rhizoctonia solani]|uniref:Uncharacterized protein n=1 Tax=Rhizoctonia solani TaxID=456999 RepID=A0A8H3CVJ1_9AGAM|nr:unnamed protein product [Rhizoctonia solani]